MSYNYLNFNLILDNIITGQSNRIKPADHYGQMQGHNIWQRSNPLTDSEYWI
ncbi:hypothetical protein DFQ12_2205 [Sphingobacterium detergens]|uniref:Uncharacterized protein n=1 Tax=Sphingobacterium detergens TaxID=1145106 RepID=A0A420BKR6_SPHD1|nr:hypothetical protein DFQ12_2205 [Sphingobacterium detergens]